jgi:hypothetical protein
MSIKLVKCWSYEIMMPWMRVIALLAFFCFIVPGLSHAQGLSADVAEETEEYILRYKSFSPNEIHKIYLAQNTAYDRMINDVVERQLTILRPKCDKIDRVVRQLPEVYEQVAFPEDMDRSKPPVHPITGQWKEIVKLKACGKIHQFNFIVSSASIGKPYILPLLNGRSNIDSIFQVRAAHVMEKRMTEIFPDACRHGGQILVQDTRVIGFIQPDRTLGQENHDRGWFEEWDIWQCREHKKAHVAMVTNELGSFDIRVQPIIPKEE